MEPWIPFLTAQDRQVYAMAGYGKKGGFGTRPALLIIDATYAFCGHEPKPLLESMKTWPKSSGDMAWQAIANIEQLLKAARSRGVPVIYTTGQDSRTDGYETAGWQRKNSRSLERPGLPGYGANEIVREIAPLPGEVVLEKLKPSAFHGTPLVEILIDQQVDTLLICGGVTSGCVRASAVDAFSYNFKVSVPIEGTFDRGEASHAMNLFDINAKYGDVVPVADCIEYLNTVAGRGRDR